MPASCSTTESQYEDEGITVGTVYLLSWNRLCLWSKLHLARWSFGEREYTFLGTVRNGAIELRDMKTTHLELVLLLNELCTDA